MTMVLSDEGQDDILNQYITARSSNLRVGLYSSRTGSGKAVVLANVGAATFSGYAAQTPTWTVIADSTAGRSRQEAAELTFTHNGGGTSNVIAGWYLYDAGTSKLLFYEDFGATITMDSSGDNIKVKPTLYCGDLTAPL